MAARLGVRDPDGARRRPRRLGMAMQRTNILRDIDEDAGNGRAYLARGDHRALRGAPTPGRARARSSRDQIRGPTRSTTTASPGSRSCARAAARPRRPPSMYREILRQIEREGLGEHAGRAVVPRRRLAVAARRGFVA